MSEDVADLVHALLGGHLGVHFAGQDGGERELSGGVRGGETFSTFGLWGWGGQME